MTTTGICLLYMGGPSDLDAVKPFLSALFADRDLIQLPGGPLAPLLGKLIVHFRSPRVRGYYEEIGGGSPLLQTTEQQARLLEQALSPDGDFAVEVAMRYCEPRVDGALERLARRGAEQLVALPLYPHYSSATTGSSFKDLERALADLDITWPSARVESFHDHPRYLDALAGTVAQALEQADGDATVVFSAHSLPRRFIERGDPYQDQVEATVDGVVRRLGLQNWRLAYQSRSGPVEWLGPNTLELTEAIIADGHRRLVLVPVSFVSDHIETLHELDIQLRERCLSWGAEAFFRAPALGSDPTFIQALKELALAACQRLNHA